MPFILTTVSIIVLIGSTATCLIIILHINSCNYNANLKMGPNNQQDVQINCIYWWNFYITFYLPRGLKKSMLRPFNMQNSQTISVLETSVRKWHWSLHYHYKIVRYSRHTDCARDQTEHTLHYLLRIWNTEIIVPVCIIWGTGDSITASVTFEILWWRVNACFTQNISQH